MRANEIADTLEFWRFCLFTLSRDLNGAITGGPRNYLRNKEVGGHEQSRHLWAWGMGRACDFMFDTEDDRDYARRAVNRAGYHAYVGQNYDPRQLHVQSSPPREAP